MVYFHTYRFLDAGEQRGLPVLRTVLYTDSHLAVGRVDGARGDHPEVQGFTELIMA